MKLLSIILWLIRRTEISFLQPLEIISKKGYESEFELSEYIWQMKDESKNCNIHWKIFTLLEPINVAQDVMNCA